MLNFFKHHLFLTILLIPISIFLFGFEIPDILMTTQIKVQTQNILNQNNASEYGTDDFSREFLTHHHLKLTDVTDSQGSTGHQSYHVGSTKTGDTLGIYVYNYFPDSPYSKTKIDSIKVWKQTEK